MPAWSAPVGMPEVGMVVIQPTAFCNIDCSYCYLPDRNNKHVIARRRLTAFHASCLHRAGPLRSDRDLARRRTPCVPIAFYREAFEPSSGASPSVLLTHAFQTNGTLIDDGWCDLFRGGRSIWASVSTARSALHDRNRMTRGGAGTFDKTIRGIRCLRKRRRCRFTSFRCSLARVWRPGRNARLFLSEGIEHVCFNVEESEGDHVSSLFAESRLRQKYQAFLRSFWHAARTSGQIRFLREIDLAIPRVFRPDDVATRNIQTEPLAMLNVDSHGNVSSFSPELLGLRNADFANFLLGNINTDTLAEIYKTCVQSPLFRDIQAGVEACKGACEYFSICGGGAPVNKLFENGSFTGTRTSYCTLTQMVPTDLILEAFDQLERSWTETDRPGTARPTASLLASAPDGPVGWL